MKRITITDNYTRWRTDDLEAWANACVQANIDYYHEVTVANPHRGFGQTVYPARPVKMKVFDWPNASGSSWVRTVGDLDDPCKDQPELTVEVQLADVRVMAQSPAEVVNMRLGSGFTLGEDSYVQFSDRIFHLLYSEYAMYSNRSSVTELLERGLRIRMDENTPANIREIGRVARSELRRNMLVVQTKRDVHKLGFRYYERYMGRMASHLESLRSSHSRLGSFPLEGIEDLKAQLRQDLEWLESIDTSTKVKIKRPKTRFVKP